jgi:AcrR family transcriptional regulator
VIILKTDRLVGLTVFLDFMKMTKAEQTQQQILDAAVEVFSQKGYHETRVDDIVAASGTSKGAVYFHFPSKETIFLSVIEEFANRLAKGLQTSIQQEESGIHRVDAALRSTLELFSKYRHLAKIFLVQAAGLGATFEEQRMAINARFASVICGYLDQAVEEGDIPEMDTEIAAMAWIGALYEVMIRFVLSGEPGPERSLPALRTFLLRSIGVAEDRIRELESELA